MRPDPRQLISDADARAMCGGISVMTRVRWSRHPQIGFPAPAVVVRGRRYYRRADIEQLIDRLAAMTASGELATMSPVDPRRRRAAKAAGGVVT